MSLIAVGFGDLNVASSDNHDNTTITTVRGRDPQGGDHHWRPRPPKHHRHHCHKAKKRRHCG